MMKNGIGKLVVLVAVLMAFLTVEAAWAGMGSNNNKTEVEIEGFITAVSLTSCSIFVDDEALAEVEVFGLGPVSYWDSMGIAFPDMEEYVKIDAYIGDLEKYVAIKVTICTVTNDNGSQVIDCEEINNTVDDELVPVNYIVLRDANYLPLWRGDGTRSGQEE